MGLIKHFFESSHWFQSNGYKLNQAKTQLVSFQTFQAKNVFKKTIFFQGQAILVSHNSNFLGIKN